jgi:hypothetical protein
VQIASREWFDLQEHPRRQAAETIALVMTGAWVMLLLVLIRWKKSRGGFWVFTVLLLGLLLALLIWSRRSTSLQYQFSDHRYTLDLDDPATLRFQARPLIFPDGPIPKTALTGTPTILFTHVLLTVKRDGILNSQITASVPFRLVAGILVFLPGIWFLGTIRKQTRQFHRRGSGRCLACGYDLRQSAAICPECGTMPRVA